VTSLSAFPTIPKANAVALAAVALGACLIEKHFTLDRNLPGPDHLASSEPDELAALIEGIRSVEAALGDGCKQPQPSETQNRLLTRKSLMAKRDLPAGSTVLRPGTGISPARAPEIIGRRLDVSVRAGSQISWNMLV
jgi:N,N'-diacetyllegionaminate synthase